jgi:hypothetical protein
MTGCSAWSVLPTPGALLAARIGRGGRSFLLLLVFLSSRRRDSVSLVLRLRILGGSSGRRTMVGGEVQDMLLCLVVGKVVF